MKTDLGNVFKSIARRIDPKARYVRHWPLTGGVSAQIDALELLLPSAAYRRVVVRRHGAANWKTHADDAMAAEFALHRTLFGAGLPVPEPLLLDVSRSVLPSPFFVMAMVEGTTIVEKGYLQQALRQMANFLLRLHDLNVESLGVAQLPRREDPVSGALEYLPDISSTAALRAAITRWVTEPTADALLHGDFWPGNILWKNNQLAAVIDWEDAAIGTVLSDLAICRAELMAMYGEVAMDTFTRYYLEGLKLETSDLNLWEIYVGSAALASMADWGLAPEVEALRRERTTLFVDRAAQKFICQT